VVFSCSYFYAPGGSDQMKFTYVKQKPPIFDTVETRGDVHTFSLEGGGLAIEASCEGVKIFGESQFFQPVDEERKIPEDFREFFVRLDAAFELAFKEQAKQKKEMEARRSILGVQ